MRAGLFISVEDALTLDLPLHDEEYLPISLLEQGTPLATSKTSREESIKRDAKQAQGSSGLSSLLNRNVHRRRAKVTAHLRGMSTMFALFDDNPPLLHSHHCVQTSHAYNASQNWGCMPWASPTLTAVELSAPLHPCRIVQLAQAPVPH